MKDETREFVQKIQTSMVESARATFEEPQLDCLRDLIRLTVEFNDYLRDGQLIMRSKAERLAEYVGGDSLEGFKHDFGSRCNMDSIFSGIEPFQRVNAAYEVLVGATSSRIEWGEISVQSLKEHFISMFQEFSKETNFEKRCRLLLDLFKIQIVFAGMFYD